MTEDRRITDLNTRDEYVGPNAVGLFEWERLETDEIVSQAGRANGFPEEPRFDRAPGSQPELDVSMIRGRRTAEEVVRAAFRRPPKKNDRVRHFEVSMLLAGGYTTYSSPSRGNPDHVSVVVITREPIESQEYRRKWHAPDRVPLSMLCEPAAGEEE